MRYYLRRPISRQALRLHRLGEFPFEGGRYLPLDVHVDEDAYVISASVPGLDPEDLKVEVLDDWLTIKGEIKVEENGTGEYLVQERTYGQFERSLRLSDPIKAEEAEAKVENGVLTVRIPKADEAKPRSIKVKVK